MENRIKEIKSFVIKQMKEGEWTKSGSNYGSKYLKIYIPPDKDKVRQVSFDMGFVFGLDDIELSYIRFILLMRSVNKSAELLGKRNKENNMTKKWESFLDTNKDINRDNKLDKIFDSK